MPRTDFEPTPVRPRSNPQLDDQITSGQRFEFGKNWQRFLSVLDEERITEAGQSLKEMLGVETLSGKSFLDVGSGSGLFSLAAMRMGARLVYSFDHDPQSVDCTRELRKRFFPDATQWTIKQGDVLDATYVQSLGQWDVVYAWGVLHHTGDLRRALVNAANLVRPDGALFVSIYNDQGLTSKGWHAIKRLYNSCALGQWFILASFIPYFALRAAVGDLVHWRNPLRGYRDYKRSRGMSRVHDWLDWLGGFPFEVARPEDVLALYREEGFVLERLKTCGGRLGCNEFIFRKTKASAGPATTC